MLGTYVGIVDGEHAGNMGGEYLWNHGWRTCWNMVSEYLGTEYGGILKHGWRLSQSRGRGMCCNIGVDDILESWIENILEHG